MKDRSAIVLTAVLRLLKPVARLLLHNGVGYPAFAVALKRVFLEAAQDELKAQGMPQTDSALTLLCGVHRRDVRTLLRAPETSPAAERAEREPLSMASEVATRWLADRNFRSRGKPKRLGRGSDAGSFDALVASVSSDIRPRAVLDELKRLGVAQEDDDGSVTLLAESFAPRQGFEEMSWLFADNLRDHVAAAAMNLQGQSNFLEQSIFVDQLTKASTDQLQQAAVLAWKHAFQSVMTEAQTRFDADAAQAPVEARSQRARFGVYFFSENSNVAES